MIIASPSAPRLGWTLLHFLWQGTAIAAVYAALRNLLARRLSAQHRYALACAALIALTIAPPLTFLLSSYAGESTSAPIFAFTLSPSDWSLFLNSVVAIWLLGVLAFLVRLSGGCRLAARLRASSHPAPAEWRQTLDRIATRIGVSFPVSLLVSSQVNVPTVIGWLRPAILVPVEFLTGLRPDYLAALLAHEIAHVRRHDYLISVLQNLAEAMLFYHPAIWWISGQIRVERELCCDDMAVAVIGDVLTYARALTELEVWQPGRLKPMLAANGGSLFHRIRRLIEPARTSEQNIPGPAFASAMILFWIAGVGVLAVHAAEAPTPAPTRISLTPDPTPTLAIRAKKALLYDPLLSAQISQPAPAVKRDQAPSRENMKTVADLLEKSLVAGDLKTLDGLLSAGLDPNLRNRFGQTPLYVAVVCDQLGAVQLLLAHHADPNEPIATHTDNVREPVTPLQYAAQSGKRQIASALVRAGAHVNSTGPAGRTALHYTAGHRLEMTQFLIEQGANVNARDAEGASPLDDAAWNGSLDAVAVLLAHGARLNELNTLTGASPLNEAAFRGHTKVVQYLLQFHPDLETPDKRGYTALDNAIRKENEDCAVLLLDAKEHWTPQILLKEMDAAIGKDESHVVETLLRHGAPVNGSLSSGATALDEAALKGAIKTARMLLDHGALVNDLSADSGTTALYAAASFGHGDIVKLLLERGANPSLCGTNNRSLCQAARPQFEVASIKLNVNCGSRRNGGSAPFPGRADMNCSSLRDMIQSAYGRWAHGPHPNVNQLIVRGAPDWVDSDLYDIEAKAEGDAPLDQMYGPMLQTLLEDRFKLQVHWETRELPVYALTVAKGGIKMTQAPDDSCVVFDINHVPTATSDQPTRKFCGRQSSKTDGGVLTLEVYAMSMPDFSERLLSARLDRPVVDKTGVTGMFDFSLKFSPETRGPSIFTALQQQLGLKLESTKGPVQVLVIDHVERPSPN